MERVTNGARGERLGAPVRSTPRRPIEARSGARSLYPPSRARTQPRAFDRIPDDRYRAGVRRVDAEPLRASWRPDASATPSSNGGRARTSGSHATRTRRRTSRSSRILREYGWRVYALPVLVVLTVIVVFDAARAPAGEAPSPATTLAPSDPSQDVTGESDEPAATENPTAPATLNIPTAVLPGGGKFTTQGKGTWQEVKGVGEKVGTGGKLYTYAIEVERGIDPSSYGGDDAFATMVEATLSDPRSWTGDGKVTLRRVSRADDPDLRISLTTPGTNHRPDVCGYTIKYESSCLNRRMGRVVINLARWVRGATAFGGDIGTYRQYAINHEVGHALGNGHVGCPKSGALAPVMMQQSFGVSNDYVAKLNKADPGNYAAVPKDSKTCKPNAWPNPHAAPSN